MYFSFIHASDLIIVIRNVSCSYQITKTLKAISSQSATSKYRVETESIKSNDNDILN